MRFPRWGKILDSRILCCWICSEPLPEGVESCATCGNLRPNNPPTEEEMASVREALARRRSGRNQAT